MGVKGVQLAAWDKGLTVNFELHPRGNLFHGASFDMFLKYTDQHPAGREVYRRGLLLRVPLPYIGFAGTDRAQTDTGSNEAMIEKRKLSMPFWCVGNPVGDPFGPGVMDEVSAFEIADIIAQAAIWDAAAEVARTMASGDPAGIAALKIDYDAVAKAPIRIGELDHLVNRKIFGI